MPAARGQARGGGAQWRDRAAQSFRTNIARQRRPAGNRSRSRRRLSMAQIHHFSATLTWTGAAKGTNSSYESYSRDHIIEVSGKPPLPGSADKVFRGDSSRHNPEDMLVVSLSACHMLTYLAEAARAGVHVVAYSDKPRGT